MEGPNSGSGSDSVSGGKGTGTSSTSSIRDLFEAEGSPSGRRKGVLLESLANTRPLFSRQIHEQKTSSESTNHDGSAAQGSSTEEYPVPRTGPVLCGIYVSSSQKGERYGKSQGDNHTSLGSSLYYGGPDLCCDPSNTTMDELLGKKKTDNSENDTSTSNMGASRGDWWQGSLYY